MKHAPNKGSIMLLVIVFGGIFFTLLAALSSFVLTGNRAETNARAQAEGLSIAEAGLDYYRWFLSHFPGNTQDGTGHAGPYVTTYTDPQTGNAVGTYSLSISANTSCGVVQSMDVTSTGVPSDAPGVQTTLVARFAPPSVASYSYIVGASVWAGSDRVINGPYHGNGGVRMDGTANAPVTSSLSTWDCTSSFGCSPEQPTAPGVVGTGTNQNLWDYPTPQIDFAAIASNFSTLKSTAVSSGIYLPRYSTSGNPNLGYHLIFNANGTITINKVTSVTALAVTPINSNDSSTDYSLIHTETFYETVTPPAGCGVIFVEDNAWLEGTIPSKFTVVAANVTTVGVVPNVFLKNNIQYAASDGSDGLTVISAGDILLTADSPTNMTLNGVFVAQSGAFGRNLFSCPGPYEPKGTLTILGTTVSNLRTGTKWVNGCGATDAGYQTRVDAFDRQNSVSPSPFTPTTSTQWQFINWQQTQ
jgi:hypothetical protein